MYCSRIRQNRPIELETWLGISVSKKNSSDLIREVSKYFQNKPGFLKRIKPNGESLSVLLCTQLDYIKSERLYKEFLESLGLDTNKIFTAQIPKTEPRTENEIKEAIAHWPCSVKPCAPESTELPPAIQKLVKKLNTNKEECAISSIILEGPDTDGLAMHTAFASTEETGTVFQHATIRMIKTISRSTTEYLCTGRTVLLSSEPCLVCGMALVHGRVKRIYIAGKDSPDAPYSKYNIHQNISLNHRIDVYRIYEISENNLK
ncbi:tRNA-specific adenosine deaminase 3 [Nematocida sp. AWRm78]|nr:tRNA-specific adenosine deaminase 3 [Nematocida sp. AWRm79]KAI5182598.1 tRNA-specific adenosine deaminase 3 [Nematocida sp. AWRm78]